MSQKNSPQSTNFSNLSGQIALITGSTSGIGLAIAQKFLLSGAFVITTGRSKSPLLFQQMILDNPSLQGNHLHISSDISNISDLKQLADSAWNRNQRIDILVNCAGADILTGSAKQLSFQEKLHQLLSVDVQGTVYLSREIGSKMKSQNRGCIINIGWDGARRGLAGNSGELFALVKGAVESFSLSLAQSLAPHVRVNVISPGWIETQWGTHAPEQWQEKIKRQTLLHRWGTPDEIASAALFLASPAANFINGHIIDVNGGFAVN